MKKTALKIGRNFIVFCKKKDGKRKYILITNISGHIGFPKGHIESGENEKQTALREIYEETGVHTTIIDGFREFYNYKINNFIDFINQLFRCAENMSIILCKALNTC